jgi:hypothetical protein
MAAVPGVYQQYLQALRFQYLMRCDPVDSGTLHRHRFYLSLFEPLRHPDQLRRSSPEIGHFPSAAFYRRGACPVTFASQISARHLVPNYRQPCDLSRTVRVILWPRGVLQEPRQCSIACLGPCLSRGIRSNGERAVTAAVSSRSILPLPLCPIVTACSIRHSRRQSLSRWVNN